MRILVTGGSGFVGSAVVRDLATAGHEVVATSRRPPAGVGWVAWDAADDAVPAVEWAGLDAVVHLASPTGPFATPVDDAGLRATVVDATARLLDHAVRAGVPRFVYVSSGDALGAVSHVPDEATPREQPTSAYGAAKAAAEALVVAAEATVVRLFHPYGPGGDRFLVNRAVRAVVDGTPFVVEGEHGIPLNPVWVTDAAAGLRLAVEASESGLFHLAGPDHVSLVGLLEVAGELVGRSPVVQRVNRRAVPTHAGHYRETARRLGYRPQVKLHEGVGMLLALYGAPMAGR